MTAATATGFRQVRNEILSRIRDRTWPLGALLPSESALAEEFDCARATVNRAMRELADAGIVERRRRAGTRVVKDPVRHAQFKIPIVRQEIERTGATYRYALLSREALTAPDWLRSRFGWSRSSKVLHVTCLHLAGTRPYQFEDRWISIAMVPKAAGESFEHISPNEWLVREVPYSDGEISFLAEQATGDMAELLQVAPGDAIFVAERMTWLGDDPVTYARMSHPGHYRVTTRF